MRSLYGKFLFFTLSIMLSSALLSFLVVNTYYHQQLKEQNDTKNMNIVKNIIHFIEKNEHIDLDDFLITEASVGYKLMLVDEKGQATLYGDAFRENNLSDEAIKNVLLGKEYHGMRDLPKETFFTGFFSDETANTVGTSFQFDGKTYGLFLRPDIKLLFTEIHYLLAGMFVFMAIISLIAMLFVARKLIQPISELTIATKKIGAEQFSVTLPTSRGDEIGELAISFQKMANQLQESDQLRKRFINDVSHDFQTPLQNIKGYAALVGSDEISDEELHQYTSIIQAETERLSVLTKQLLLLTSLDSLTEQMDMEPFSVSSQLTEVLQRYRWLMVDKNISLTAEIDDITMCGNQAYIEKVWENLLSNALKYTTTGGMIDITLTESSNGIIATFKDNGIGIHENNIPHLFERFFRVDDARHAEIEGTGLGLAIVHQIVSLHSGKIDVTSTIGKGTTFTVYLPKKFQNADPSA